MSRFSRYEKTMRRLFGFGLIASTTLVLSLYGCSSDDSTTGDDTTDSGPGNDATSQQDVSAPDTSTPNDSGIPDGNVIDAGVDAATHIAFLTTAAFTGNLVGAANAADAGTVSLDGGAFTDYVSASDALCTADAKRAGRSGKFIALVEGGSDNMFARIHDSDGPWALPDGTPVADTVAALTAGDMHAAIDETITSTRVQNESYVWGRGATGEDCNGFTDAEMSASVTSAYGIAGFISPYAWNGANGYCSSANPLYCLEVGSGGGANHYPAVPAGGKIAFLAVGPYPNTFANSDAGVLDAAAPSGDAVHEVGDAICSELAAGAGQSGEFHAWLSSSTTGAGAYFTGLSMNGPWYRSDGIEVASSLTDLTTNGAHTQIAIDAAGHFPASFTAVQTGTNNDGTASENCDDFTISDAGVGVASGYETNKLGLWTDSDGFPCTIKSGIYCFEK